MDVLTGKFADVVLDVVFDFGVAFIGVNVNVSVNLRRVKPEPVEDLCG